MKPGWISANEDKKKSSERRGEFCRPLNKISYSLFYLGPPWVPRQVSWESPGPTVRTFALNNICGVWFPQCRGERLISDWASSIYLMNSFFVPAGSASLMNGSLCHSLSLPLLLFVYYFSDPLRLPLQDRTSLSAGSGFIAGSSRLSRRHFAAIL